MVKFQNIVATACVYFIIVVAIGSPQSFRNISFDHSKVSDKIHICGVIYENLVYGGINSSFLDLSFPYIYIQRLFSNLCRKREKCLPQMLICDKKSRL